MDNYSIVGTKSTPEIELNFEARTILIKGESYPENSFKFYQPVFEWIENYLALGHLEPMKIEIRLNYLNTSSTKSIMHILDLLEEGFLMGVCMVVHWYYDEENESSYEIAQSFMDSLELPFKLIKEE